MNKTLNSIIFIILCMIGYIWLHELTHATIYEYYDCYDIEYHLELGWYPASVSAYCYDEDHKLAQSINEIIGYNVMPFLIILIYILYYHHLKDV